MTVSSAGIVTFKDDILIKDGGTIDARVSLGGGSINTDNTFSGGQTFTGVYNYELLIDIHMTSTAHFIGGGYIRLNAPT